MGNDEFGWSFDPDNTLGGRLSLAREARALSVEQVACVVHCPPDTLRYWESDRAAPSPSRLLAIAEVLDVAVSWLMTGFGHGPHWDDLTEVPRRTVSPYPAVGPRPHSCR